jgi:hypothetical protein
MSTFFFERVDLRQPFKMYVASFKLSGLGFAHTFLKVTALDRNANIGRCEIKIWIG